MSQSATRCVYRFTFRRHVDIEDAADCLTLAVCAAEGLHGNAKVRLDGRWQLDRQRRTCTIDASTQVGQDIARLFTGFLAQEFGENAFSVRHDGGPMGSIRDQITNQSEQGGRHV